MLLGFNCDFDVLGPAQPLQYLEPKDGDLTITANKHFHFEEGIGRTPGIRILLNMSQSYRPIRPASEAVSNTHEVTEAATPLQRKRSLVATACTRCRIKKIRVRVA